MSKSKIKAPKSARDTVIAFLGCDKYISRIALAAKLAEAIGVEPPSEYGKCTRFIKQNYRKLGLLTNPHPNVKPKKKKAKSSADFYKSREWRDLRYIALRNSNGECGCCGAKAGDGVQIHVDHIKPRSKFPLLELDLGNLQILCDDCNIGKSNIFHDDWRQNV